MSKIIDLSRSVYDLCKENPELITVMVDLGFENIANPAMLHTAGRFMTIPKGAAMKGISLEQIKENLRNQGFEIIE